MTSASIQKNENSNENSNNELHNALLLPIIDQFLLDHRKLLLLSHTCCCCKDKLKAQILQVIMDAAKAVPSKCDCDCVVISSSSRRCIVPDKDMIENCDYSNRNGTASHNPVEDAIKMVSDERDNMSEVSSDTVSTSSVRKQPKRSVRKRRSVALLNGAMLLHSNDSGQDVKSIADSDVDSKSKVRYSNETTDSTKSKSSSKCKKLDLSKIPKLRRKSRRTSVMSRWPDLYKDMPSNPNKYSPTIKELSPLSTNMLNTPSYISDKSQYNVESKTKRKRDTISETKLSAPAFEQLCRSTGDVKNKSIELRSEDALEENFETPSTSSDVDIPVDKVNFMIKSDNVQDTKRYSYENVGSLESTISSITAQEISNCAMNLYGVEFRTNNCMLPIIFALLTISKPPSVDIDSSLVLLFKELVNAEHTLTASKYFHYTNSDINAHVTPRQKVSFQAFDFSSVSPPSDRENGSDIETNTSIQSIKRILDCVKTICIDSLINNESIIFTLKFIVSFFQLLSNWSLSQMPYLFECFKSIKESSICCLGQFYKNEFHELLNYVSCSENKIKMPVPFSSIRKRLSNLLRSSIRYSLRQRLNSVPPHFTASSSLERPHKLPNHYDCRSKVHEFVCMIPNGQSDSAWDGVIGDGSVSAVVNIALQRIDSFFKLFKKENQNHDQYFDICQELEPYVLSRSTLTGYKSGSNILDDSLVIHEVLADIDVLLLIISTFNSIEFLINLFEWPCVRQAIEDAGGWGNIEAAASIIVQQDIILIDDSIAHFALLQNFDSLLYSLHSVRRKIEILSEEAQCNLKKIWSRFRCGSKKPGVYKSEMVMTIKPILTCWKSSTCMPQLKQPDPVTN